MDEQVNTGVTVVTPEIMRRLTDELPLNDFGLPIGIYRSDLLPIHEFRGLGQPNLALPSPEAPTEPQGRARTADAETISEVADDSSRPHSESTTAPLTLAADEVVAEPVDTGVSVDPFLILAGSFPGGDGEAAQRPHPRSNGTDTPLAPLAPVAPKEYLIAGFPWASLQKAFVPLHFDEGFPSFDTGAAFWDKMPFEPMEAFQAFQRYCQMARGRSPDYEDEEDYGEAASGSRSISLLVGQMYPRGDDALVLSSIDRFKEYYHLYYWGLRARAYDLFRVAQYRQQQELRAIETQDDHYIQSRKLRHRLSQYMDSEEEFWDLMTPKVAIDMLKQLTTLERISAGIPATGPQVESERAGQSLEVALRTVAQTHSKDKLTTIDEDGNVLDEALNDAAATEILQQLIIRTGGGS